MVDQSAKPMETITKERIYDVQENLEAEEKAISKNEFHNGTLIPVSGASFIHNIIASKLIHLLIAALSSKESKYFVSNSDTKIHIPALNSFVYPDAVVVSGPPAFYQQRTDTITNPLLIVEVLSPGTEGYDRDLKFEGYLSIPSFQQYVLVRQERPYISTFYRKDEELWRRTNVQGNDQQIHLTSLDVTLALSDIYEGIDTLRS